MVRALVLYHSITGNTMKVANALAEGLEEAGDSVTMRGIAGGVPDDLLEFDLVCLGAPSIQFLPPKPMLDFVAARLRLHNQRGDVKVRAPQRPGKHGVVFITYSGQHTGIAEATTAGKYLAQFLAHLGFALDAEWYIPGEYHNNEVASTQGWLGDIRGRPNAADLAEIKGKAGALAHLLSKEG